MQLRQTLLPSYPKIDEPIVSVRTDFRGASPEIIESQITRPLEDSIAGIEGIKVLSSTSRAETSRITVQFRDYRDPDDAASDVRDRVARVRTKLPIEAKESRVSKVEADASPIVWLTLSSDDLSMMEISYLAKHIVKPRLQSLNGAADVRIFGDRRFSMRIWLDESQLASYGLTIQDVEEAIRQQNIEIPAVELVAEKLIFIVDEKLIPYDKNKTPIEISSKSAKEVLKTDKLIEKGELTLFNAIKSCEGGVKRTHLIPFQNDGVIFLELFTHSGIGAMIVEENLEALRPAILDDIGAIIALIHPHEKNGTLRFRERNLIEQEINLFTVIEHDGVISGCANLKPYHNNQSAELGCLIVDKKFQGKGQGERLLIDAEKKAKKLGALSLFALTTIATHWFLKRGFTETTVDKLPEGKELDESNHRGSKLLQKKLF